MTAWSELVSSEDNVDQQWKALSGCIISLLKACIPRKVVYITPRDKVWMTPLAKMLINEKWAAYRSGNGNRFNELKTPKEIEKAKSLWARKLKRSPYGLWKLTKQIRGKDLKSKLEPLITQASTPQHLAEQIAKNLVTDDPVTPTSVFLTRC